MSAPAFPGARTSRGAWLDGDRLVFDGVEFVVSAEPDDYMNGVSTPERFVLAKHPDMVDLLSDVVQELQPRRIFELGIFKGGSTALLALLTRPERLTAVEIEAEPVAALETFLTQQGLRSSVSCRYGVDQAGRDALHAILREEHDDEPLDLVIDDASHQLRHTRASFEVLFPRLRPGGIFLLEDWAWAHYPLPVWQEGGGLWHDQPALSNLLVELMMMVGTRNELIEDITITKDIALIKRGGGVAREPIRLEDHYLNRGLPFRPLL